MRRKKNLIIAFEGLDCSFKETLFNVVKDNFDEIIDNLGIETKNKINLYTESFPRYHDSASSMIKNLLDGQYKGVNPYNMSFSNSHNRPNLSKIARNCFMADFFDYWYNNKKGFMNIEHYEIDWYDLNNIFLFDRYIFSNAIYNPIEQSYCDDNAVDMLTEANIGIPAPDFVIWCNHSKFETLADLVAKKKNKDANEMNLDYLKEVWLRANRFLNKVPDIRLTSISSPRELKNTPIFRVMDEPNNMLSSYVFDARTGTKFITLEVSCLDGKCRPRNTLSSLAMNIVENIIKEGILL